MHAKRHITQREKHCLFSGLVKFKGFLVGGLWNGKKTVSREKTAYRKDLRYHGFAQSADPDAGERYGFSGSFSAGFSNSFESMAGLISIVLYSTWLVCSPF